MATNSSFDKLTPQRNDGIFSTSKSTVDNVTSSVSKRKASEDVLFFDESSSVSKLPSKKLAFSPGDTTITDDTVLDDFDFGEEISDNELKERFKNENWLVFASYFYLFLLYVTFIITQIVL